MNPSSEISAGLGVVFVVVLFAAVFVADFMGVFFTAVFFAADFVAVFFKAVFFAADFVAVFFLLHLHFYRHKKKDM